MRLLPPIPQALLKCIAVTSCLLFLQLGDILNHPQGHFYLTHLLLDVLLNTPASRIVLEGSALETIGSVNWQDLM